MILPLIGQECVVTFRSQRHLTRVTKAGTNALGQYRITVYGHMIGHDVEYKADEVALVDLVINNQKYDARAAFGAVYTRSQAEDMLAAEMNTYGTQTGRVSSAAPQVSNTPKSGAPLQPIARRVVRGAPVSKI